MNKKTEVATQEKVLPTVQDNTPDSLIALALTQNADVEKLEKLFALREKVKAEQAREAFVQAMADFQSECPVIEKSKKVLNKDGRTVRYQYAPLDAIVSTVRPILAKHGLSYSVDTANEPGAITATCKITHKLGHSDTSSFRVPVDSEGFMTAPQKVASALTFAKRYAFCNVLGILTGDEDTDATDVKEEKKPISIRSQIMFLLKTLEVDTTTKVSVEAGAERLTDLELVEENFEEIKSRLEILVSERNGDVSKTI